jgi:hypothetical protein
LAETRKLGEQERLLNYLHGHGGLIATSVMHVRGRLSPELLRSGLDWLQSQHAILRAHITYGRTIFTGLPPFVYRQPSFVTEGTVAIPLHVVEFPDPDAWRRVLSTELRTPITRGRNPRLRVTLVRQPGTTDLSHIVVCADHATLDAQSGNMLTRQLMEYLADPEAARQGKQRDTILPPPMEQGLPIKPDSGTRGYEPAIRLPVLPVKGAKPETRVFSHSLAPGETAVLKEAIKANRTTLHGAVTSAFLLAIGERYGLEAMTVLTTVDLRRLMQPALTAETYGCYIDILRTRNPIGRDFWKMAREVSFRLITTLARDQESASILKVFDWGVYRHEFRGMVASKGRIDGLAVTTAPDSGLRTHYGDFELEDLTTAVSLDLFGPSIFVIANERGGGLDLSVGFAAQATAEEEVRALAARAMAVLTMV